MIHFRKDYNNRIIDTANKIGANEPVFLLLGRDEATHVAVEAWCNETERLGNKQLADHVREFNEKIIKKYENKKPADCPDNLLLDIDAAVNAGVKVIKDGGSIVKRMQIDKIKKQKKQTKIKLAPAIDHKKHADEIMKKEHEKYKKGIKTKKPKQSKEFKEIITKKLIDGKVEIID